MDHRVPLSVTVRSHPALFHRGSTISHPHQLWTRGPKFSTSGTTRVSDFWTVAILLAVKWYLLVVVMVSDIFVCFLFMDISPWKNVYVSPLPIF